ncbi:MAG: hypothetical protein AAFP13_02040 [Pseudomonadota bacterium]
MMGAGGNEGGTGLFLIGLAMMVAGGYLLLNGIIIRPQFGLGTGLFRLGGFPVTTGMVLIPFIFGVVLIFYNSKNLIGWGLAAASLIAMVAGVIASIQLTFARMSVFDLVVILVLFFGGLGLFLRSLRASR